MIALRVEGDPIPQTNGVFFLHADHLGSTSLTPLLSRGQATDASGTLVARQLYDAWGNVRLRGDVKTDIGYTSQREDRSINLMFYRARYYSSALGRFVSADTIVPDGKNPQQFNRYAYTLNNPVKYNDPTGHDVGCAGKDAGQCSTGPQHNTTQLGSSAANTINPPPEDVPSTYPWEWITPKEPKDLTRYSTKHDWYLACDHTGLNCSTRTSYLLIVGEPFNYSAELKENALSKLLGTWGTSFAETGIQWVYKVPFAPLGALIETVELFEPNAADMGEKIFDIQRSQAVPHTGKDYNGGGAYPAMQIDFDTHLYALVPDLAGGSFWVEVPNSVVWINQKPYDIPSSVATQMEQILKNMIH